VISHLRDLVRLGPITSGAKRALVYLIVVFLLIDAGEFYLFARSINTLTTQQHAQCQFYDDLGAAPVTAPSSAKKAPLGVQVISDARVAWHRLGCPGTQHAPDPTFVTLAHRYNLPTS